MNYKLVVLDIDDTIKDSDGKISDKDIYAIKEAINKGVNIALCSGRPTGSIIKSLEDSGFDLDIFDKTIIIGYNGSEAKIGSKELYSTTLSPEISKNILEKCSAMDANVACFSKDAFHVLRNDEWANYYSDKLSYMVPSLDKNIHKGNYFKMVVMQKPDDINNIKTLDNVCESEFAGKIQTFRAKTQFLDKEKPCAWYEIMPAGIHKGYAVRKLAEILGIKLSDVMVIGDGINDKEMFEIPEVFSVLMGNTRYPELKSIVKYVTSKIGDEDPGVYSAFKKYVLVNN